MFEWVVAKDVLKRGQQFSELALSAKTSESAQCHQERMVAREPTFVAILNRDDYAKVVKRLTGDVGKKKIEFIQSIPYFSKLSFN